MKPGYAEDLAHIHDEGYAEFSRNAAITILEELIRRGLIEGRVVDLGCGSGHGAALLSKAGYPVTGIDLSPTMISMARARVPSGDFRVGSLWSAKLPPCIAVTAWGECLNYLFDERSDGTALRRLFERVYSALPPKGIFVFDVAGPGRVGSNSQHHHRLTEKWAVLLTQSERARILSRHITVFRKVGTTYRRSRETHRLRLYPPAEVARLLRAAGFRVRRLRSYGDILLPKALAGFIAAKP